MNILEDIENRERDLSSERTQLYSYEQRLRELQDLSVLQERAKVALNQVLPLLSADNIKHCVTLCNLAIDEIFRRDDIEGVEFDVQKQAFTLCYSSGLKTDIATAESGGMTSVISIVLTLFLITSLGHRRVLVTDEQFSGISTAYIENFYSFLRKLAKDLNIDILMVTHDKRVTADMVDQILEVREGKVRNVLEEKV
jgi:ABC-type branched-subunit amino acid transport system ATPase component